MAAKGRRVCVKICGVCSEQDACVVADAGADAIGVNLFPGSKRFTRLGEAAPWLAPLAGTLSRVAVVVDPSPEEISAIRNADCFDAIQFHGSETPGFCAASGFPRWIKAIRVRDRSSLSEALAFPSREILLDAWVPNEPGGTGHQADWTLCRDFIQSHPDREVYLAGGLTPDNVAEAIRAARPFAVDVASGVEAAPRAKDPLLVREFIRRAREADTDDFLQGVS